MCILIDLWLFQYLNKLGTGGVCSGLNSAHYVTQIQVQENTLHQGILDSNHQSENVTNHFQHFTVMFLSIIKNPINLSHYLSIHYL